MRDSLECGAYRIGGCVLLNFVDDPVWLALILC